MLMRSVLRFKTFFVKEWSDLGNKQSGIVISLFIGRVYILFFPHRLVNVIPTSDNL